MADYTYQYQPGGKTDTSHFNPDDPITKFRKQGDNYVNPETGESLSSGAWSAAYANWDKSRLASQGLNADSSAIAPEFISGVDPTTGKMRDALSLKPQAYDPSNLESYSAYKKNALAPGLTEGGKYSKQLLDLQQANNLSNQAAKSNQAVAMGRSSLGMRGGLSSGARERLATSGSKDLMAGNQGIYNQGSQNLLNLGVSDSAQKQNMLGNLMSTDTNIGSKNTADINNASQFNITNALNDTTQRNTANNFQYQEMMKKWAAGKQADATANSGGGGK